MYEYLIEGGYPISGKVTASGNKNAALPCIAASLLTSEPVILHNIPEIRDTNVMFEILKSLGAQVDQLSKNNWKIQCKDIKDCEIPSELTKKVRGSIVFAGPLIARNRKCNMNPPGGDVIGRRRVDTHFLAFKELGVNIHVNGHFSFTANKLVGSDIFLDEASVTGTENAIMAAVMAEGSTYISNAASEPHVQDLCKMLNMMGAKISGIGSNKIIIDGVKIVVIAAHIAPSTNHIETSCAVAASHTAITIARPIHINGIICIISKLLSCFYSNILINCRQFICKIHLKYTLFIYYVL